MSTRPRKPLCVLVSLGWRGRVRFWHWHWPRESVTGCAKVARRAAEAEAEGWRPGTLRGGGAGRPR